MKPPPFLESIYADLRDRHLLPVVGVLLVAIMAVPVLLKSDAPPPPQLDPAAAESAAAEAIPTLPAVLASEPGLRDYRERLDDLRSKDPFRGQSQPEPAAVADAAVAAVSDSSSAGSAGLTAPTASGSSGSASGSTSLDAATSTTSGSSAPNAAAVSSSPSTETGSESGSKSDHTKSDDGSKTKTEEVEVAYRVDLEVGPAGATERRKDVKPLTVLPDDQKPVAMFIGAGEDGERAVFLVSDGVVASNGDGSCLPSATDCEFLTLEPGEKRRFDYGLEGQTERFVIKVRGIGLEPIAKDAERAEEEAGEESEPRSALAAIEAWLGL